MGAGPRPMLAKAAAVENSADPGECSSALQLLAVLVDAYCQIETNEKQKQDTKMRLLGLQERLQSGDVSAPVVSQLNALLQALQASNYPAARGTIGTLSAKNWQDCKDWINAIKVIATLK